MAVEKRALMCVFRPNKLKTTQEMREWFAGSYPRFLEMEPVEFKCWWCDQEKQEWGAFYVFKSEKALKEYIASDVWQKVVPEKYGCVPTWNIVEVGLIISKKMITAKENSWISD
jgi:predicted methyltransferase